MKEETKQKIILASEGDDKALISLMHEKMRQVLFLCTKIMGNLPDGEDAAQEVFIKLQKNISTLKEPSTFNVWLNKIIISTCSNIKKQKSRVNNFVNIDDYDDFLPEENIEFLPAKYFEEKESREKLLAILDKFPERYKEVTLLYYYEGFLQKEIAEILGITASSVDHTLRRVREKIKVELLEEQKEEQTNKEKIRMNSFLPVLALALKTESEELLSNDVLLQFEERLNNSLHSSTQDNLSEKSDSDSINNKKINKKVVTVSTMVTLLLVVVIAFIINQFSPFFPSFPNSSATNSAMAPQPNGSVVAEELDIIYGTVYVNDENSVKTKLNPEDFFAVKVNLLNSAGDVVATSDVTKEGEYQFSGKDLRENETYTVEVELPENSNYFWQNVATLTDTVTFNKKTKEYSLPQIYLKNYTTPAVGVRYYNEKNERSAVNPVRAEVEVPSNQPHKVTWQIIDKSTGKIVKQGEGKQISKEEFALPNNGTAKEYTVKVTVENQNGNSATDEEVIIVTP